MGKSKGKAKKDLPPAGKGKKVLNPFEIRVNKSKFKVLGRQSKFERGFPGVSRAKAFKKRKETLLLEYKTKDKSNRFFDRRIGENNKAMTAEDKIIARFTVEKMKAHKKTIFNLADEGDNLTHKGRSISEIEKFDNPGLLSDEEDDNAAGQLNADFVDAAHFGSGLLSKSSNDKSKRESVINQLIEESKKRKAERQMLKEKTVELTEKLDSEWRDLIPTVRNQNCFVTKDDPVETPVKKDDYDLALGQLRFEARGKPSDKLKSSTEIAEEEAKRLHELEEQRLMRMRGEDPEEISRTKESRTPKHRSADDLNDDFDVGEKSEFSLTYNKDGQAVIPSEEDNSDESGDDSAEVKIREVSVDSSDDESENGDSSDGGDDNDSGADDLSDLKVSVPVPDDEEDISANEDEDDKEENHNDGLSYLKRAVTSCDIFESGVDEVKLSNSAEEEKQAEKSKLNKVENRQSKSISCEDIEKEISVISNIDKEELEKSASENESLECTSKKTLKKREEVLIETAVDDSKSEKPTFESSQNTKVKKVVTFKNQLEEVECISDKPIEKPPMSQEEIRIMLQHRKEMMIKAQQELPYTFTMPTTYEELTSLLEGKDTYQVAVVVERVIKCHHPSLNEGNKELLASLFTFLIQYLVDLDNKDCWTTADRLIPILYDLVHFVPAETAHCFVEVIKEKHSDYLNKKHKYPGHDTLLLLKLATLLFPASDKRHYVTTPCMAFILEMLQCCHVVTRRSVASGLFLVTLLLECVSLSRRYCPQAINFLQGLLHMACPISDSSQRIPALPPPFNERFKLLYLQQPYTHKPSLESSELDSLSMTWKDLSTGKSRVDDSFRIRSLMTTVKLLSQFIDLYTGKSIYGNSCQDMDYRLDSSPPFSLIALPKFKHYVSCLEISKYPSEVASEISNLNQKISLLSPFEDTDGSVKNIKPLLKLTPLCRHATKPKALRMYEPTIEPVYDTKRYNVKNMSQEKIEHNKLLHKYKREMKGAVREIRRDTSFIARIKSRQQIANDAERKRKVDEIIRSGAMQQCEANRAKKKIKTKF